MDYKELEKVYVDIAKNCDKENYKLLFSLQSLLLNLVDYDPVTNLPLPTTLDDCLDTVIHTNISTDIWWNDRFQNIIDFASDAIILLIDVLHEKNIREYHVNHPSKIREVDSKCLMWLSNKPGFTIKQKIASRQKMMGVYHSTSLDTSENRLFKAFLFKIDNVLTEKATIARKFGIKIPSETERLMMIVHSWRYSDECAQISDWNNIPPNNTLLSDKNYRKVWISWSALQRMDLYNAKDLERIQELKNTALFWIVCAVLNRNKNIRFCQQVLKAKNSEDAAYQDYNLMCMEQDASGFRGFYSQNKNAKNWMDFSILRKEDKIRIGVGNAVNEISLPENISCVEEILEFVQTCIQKYFAVASITEFQCKHRRVLEKVEVAAIDVNGICPAFANDKGEEGYMTQKLLFQSFGTDPCSCANSKCIDTQEGTPLTFSIHHVFSEIDYEEKNDFANSVLENDACRSFTRTIRDEINCNKCVYVVDDDIDDFSKAVVAFKRSMNSAFVQAEILPRSIAYIFELSKKVKFSNHQIVHVSNKFDDGFINVDVEILFDEELLKRNPGTKGFKFIRHTPKRESSKAEVCLLTDHDRNILGGEFTIDGESLTESRKNFVKDSEKVISANTNCAVGALEFERLQKITPDIPLWGDILPPLKMVSDGVEYNLVELNKTIFAIRGKPVNIPVKAKFECPANREYFEFNLVQGNAKSRYFAYIKDNQLPFREAKICSLKLTYTYGDEFPYRLEFVPQDKAIKPLRVSWETKSHKDLLQLPYPEFVHILSWEEVCSLKTRDRIWDKNQKKMVLSETDRSPLDRMAEFYDCIKNSHVRPVAKVSPLKDDPEKCKVFLDLDCGTFRSENPYNGYIKIVTINPFYYAKSSEAPVVGEMVWFSLVQKGKNWMADHHFLLSDKNPYCFVKGMRLFSKIIWNGAKSIYDEGCPEWFREYTVDMIENIIPQKVYVDEGYPDIVLEETNLLFTRLHKDTPAWFVNCIREYGIRDIPPLWIAFALGDCSQEWQQEKLEQVFESLEKNQSRKKMIWILAVAIWREKKFVFQISAKMARVILNVIDGLLSEFLFIKKPNRYIVLELFRSLDCLLGLCRLRENGDQEILKVLSPYANESMKRVVEQLKVFQQRKWITQDGKWLFDTGIPEPFYVKPNLAISVSNDSDKNVPELLQAALGYLSGSINSNAIKILDVDFDDEQG